MGHKLGLDQIRPEDIHLMAHFEKVLSTVKPDMTIFFQRLIDLSLDLEDEQDIVDHFQVSLYNDLSKDETQALYSLIKTYIERIKKNTCTREDAVKRMRENNPRFILRNYLLHQAIEELERGEDQLFLKLQAAVKDPYSKNFDEFFVKRPAWASKKAGCSMLSCSS